jgi:DNA-binding NarL/FixJ family response regulator
MTMNDKIRVVVVDDHPLLREGVVKTLGMQPDFEVVGQGATADDASDLACDLLPDILLLDINIRDSGLHAIREIADSCPAIKLVILTASEQEGDVAPAELVAVLRAVYAGEVYITPSLAASLLHEMAASRGKASQLASPLDKLTDREREILEGVAAGLSNTETWIDGGEAGSRHRNQRPMKHSRRDVKRGGCASINVRAAYDSTSASSSSSGACSTGSESTRPMMKGSK